MLPPVFFSRDKKASIVQHDGGCAEMGVVEFGFMSTTTDRAVALNYASNGGPSAVFEIQMGLVDRGADISWLSQYPGEKEVLFAPLTSLEVIGTHVDGECLVVDIRLNVNYYSSTIEEVSW